MRCTEDVAITDFTMKILKLASQILMLTSQIVILGSTILNGFWPGKELELCGGETSDGWLENVHGETLNKPVALF